MPFASRTVPAGAVSRRDPLAMAAAERVRDQLRSSARRSSDRRVGPAAQVGSVEKRRDDLCRHPPHRAPRPCLAGRACRGEEVATPAMSPRRASCCCRGPACRGRTRPRKLQLPADQARQHDAEGQSLRELQALLLLRPGRGRPADDRQADGKPTAVGPAGEDDDPNRLIFLGSLALGDEHQPLAYGDDPKRNMAGVLERIAPFNWRLVIPWPQSTSKLDVFELTPVDFTQQPQ